MYPEAKIILDSVSPAGVRLTTMEVTCHRFILAEFNTHRVFSRNSASSRAIPVEKQLARVRETPALPLEWASEKPGMQGGTELEGEDLQHAYKLFELVRQHTVNVTEQYLAAHPDKSKRLHKSLINRLLEPFMDHKIIVTATEWDNFFGLRCNPMAQPEIKAAADLMKEAYDTSTPSLVEYGEWHTPYIQPDEYDLDRLVRCRVSAARCARVSYLTHDGVRDLDKDLELYERLTSETPPHASPLEHVATPASFMGIVSHSVRGNFVGWHQLRHWGMK